ncbi:Uncharacterised protein [Mycobacterium tuberculosis]|nr:Uncharacterised protein [Mycobacterium tuberculosis]
MTILRNGRRYDKRRNKERNERADDDHEKQS